MKFSTSYTTIVPIEDYMIVAYNDNLVALLEIDESPQSPRDMSDCHVGVITFASARSFNWSLGDSPLKENGLVRDQFEEFIQGYLSRGRTLTWDEDPSLQSPEETRKFYDPREKGDLCRYLSDTFDTTVVYAVTVMSHSGEWLQWVKNPDFVDSFYDFFIFDTKESRNQSGISYEESVIDAALQMEIEDLDAYFRGDVYGWVVAEHTDGDITHIRESVWGYYKDTSAREEAKEVFANESNT